ncbi:RNA polymerase sigma factor [Actinospongicola halichondriae]|uniref:RNA polymerase sigma factor n=1 Tax=Actinospongicola halichondriae TaxID=3236844 RepID=UPI003D39D4F7
MDRSPTELAEIVRVEGRAVLATLARRLGSLDLAEDAVQDAMVKAIERWPAAGVPDRPGAWLTTTAHNAALDRLRREGRRGPKEEAAMVLLADDDPEPPHASVVSDDLLRLVFTCCHPALHPEARVALALRTLCGLTTAEVAAAFLVAEPTMAQRIVRAKRKIAAANIPYRVPADHELPDRLPAVLAVVYVVFTEAHHSSTAASPVRVDLGDEAIRLGRLLVDLMPDVPECQGLLALMLATHARRAARLDDAGDIVLLGDQDRRRWDHDAIAEAAAIVEGTLRRREVGPYQVQAAIACLHGLAASNEATDWPQIAELYGILEQLQPTPVVRVNRAAAVAEAVGPEAGLAVLDTVEGVDQWHLFHAARADLLRRLERRGDALAAYRQALACGPNGADRRFLMARIEDLGSTA